MAAGSVARAGRTRLAAVAAGTRPGQVRERRIAQRGEWRDGQEAARARQDGAAAREVPRAARGRGQGGEGGQGEVLGAV
jgi:hypothetical protein